jgi:undecaprenyl-diphosphatase
MTTTDTTRVLHIGIICLILFISSYGREVFWIGVLIMLWVVGGRTHRNTVFTLMVIFVVVSVLGVSLKALLYRPRPYEMLSGVQLRLAPLGDSSFPSGHALIVMAGASTAWLRLPKRYATPLVMEAVLVAFSRIHGGVHYPLDVVAGSLLGIGVTCLVFARIPSVESVFRGLYRSARA